MVHMIKHTFSLICILTYFPFQLILYSLFVCVIVCVCVTVNPHDNWLKSETFSSEEGLLFESSMHSNFYSNSISI